MPDARRTAAQAVLSKMNTVYESVSANPQLADVFLRGTASLSALSPGEAIQFSALLQTFIRCYEELLYYRRAGAVGDWVWESVELVVMPQLTTPGGLEWWAKRKSWFTSTFQEHVANVLPTEAVETLTTLERAIEGKEFRSGLHTETGSTETASTETGSTAPLSKEAGQ